MKYNIPNSILSIAIIFIFGMYPLLPQKLESFSVIILLCCSLIIYFKSEKGNKMINSQLLITSSIFFVFVISAFLSEDWRSGFKKIETMLSLLIIPLIFYFFLIKSKLDFYKLRKYFFKIYYFSNIIYCVIAIYIFSVYKNPRYPIKDANFFRVALSENSFIGDHPIYISLFLSIAILFGFTFINFRKMNIRNSIFLIIGQGVLFILLFLLMSKGVIIALLISLLLFFFQNTKFKMRFVFLFLSLGFIFFVLIPSQNNRFIQLFEKKTYTTLDLYNSTSIRVNILKCGFQLGLANPIFGYGLGDIQRELDYCYNQNKLKFPIGKYNSHNQYLFIWLSTGIFGLFIFIYWLFFYYKNALKSKDSILISILILYSITFLFENVLSRQSGVIFFSFIINFLTISNSKRQLNS